MFIYSAALCMCEQVKISKFRENIEPVRKIVREQPFLGGQTPNYSDYTIASLFLLTKSISTLQVTSDF